MDKALYPEVYITVTKDDRRFIDGVVTKARQAMRVARVPQKDIEQYTCQAEGEKNASGVLDVTESWITVVHQRGEQDG